MTGLHGVHATDASVGATAGTFDDINTVGDPQILVDQATRYYGYCFSGSPVAQTTNEAQSGRIRLTSTSLSLVGEIFTYGAAIGAQIATNDQGAYFPVVFEPLDIRASGAERISLACSSAEQAPFPEGSFDVVVASDVIEHAARQGDFVAGCGRMLKPGGILFLATPNRFSLGLEPHVRLWGVGHGMPTVSKIAAERRAPRNSRPTRS